VAESLIVSDRLYLVRGADLSVATAQTGGMSRRAAISGDLVGSRAIWMGQTHVAPGATSGPHHHGHSETGIFVVSGHPVFISQQGGREVRLEAGPGDYVYIPPEVPHIESNEGSTEEAVVVIARTTQEAIVVNLESLTP
jgi:uncharacterized RmlC-like cupin family protein